MTVSWAPTLAEVASCIPLRTINVTIPGDETPQNTFNTTTLPTATDAQPYIDRSVNDVLSRVSSVPTALEQVAKNAAMWRSAADIELAYIQRDADTDTYNSLDARAKYEWDLFIKASEDTGGSVDATLPEWSFPNPVSWGDTDV